MWGSPLHEASVTDGLPKAHPIHSVGMCVIVCVCVCLSHDVHTYHVPYTGTFR